MIHALQPEMKTLRHSLCVLAHSHRDTHTHSLRCRDTENVTCCYSLPGKLHRASEKRVESRERCGEKQRGGTSVNVSLSTHKLAHGVCVSVCWMWMTFWTCVKHNEGVNSLISDFQNEFAFKWLNHLGKIFDCNLNALLNKKGLLCLFVYLHDLANIL